MSEMTVTLGGFVETFAFGSQGASSSSSSSSSPSEVSLEGLAMPEKPFSPCDASAVSSMAPSSVFDLPSCPYPLDPQWRLLQKTLMSYPTFPVPLPVLADGDGGARTLATAAATTTTTTSMVLGDGGNLENLGLFSLLQRGVGSAVLFLNTEVPLARREVWDPWTQPPFASTAANSDNNGKTRTRTTNSSSNETTTTTTMIDTFLAAYFGLQFYGCEVGTAAEFSNSMQDIRRNQVFRNDARDPAFARLASRLQKGLEGGGSGSSGGKGAVATVEVETVENRWLQVRGGVKLSLTVVYLATPPHWEAQLPPGVAELVKRGREPSASSAAELKNFPHYSTLGQLKLSAAEANLLAELTTWTVLQNADAIRAALMQTGQQPTSDGGGGANGGAEGMADGERSEERRATRGGI